MNIFRPQLPYTFRPPKYTPWMAPFILGITQHFLLRRKFKIREVHTEGVDALCELAAQGHSLLVTPNHADHADPHILHNSTKACPFHFHFMAAREGFEQEPIVAAALQRMGVFSVDREGADVASIKTAIKIIAEGKHPLVIFPEGEIYHHHEHLDELNEGVATMLLRAADRVKDGRSCYVVPTALHYRFDPQVAETFSDRVDRLEERITWKPRPHIDVVERIYRLGSALLAIKEEEFLGQSQSGTLVERIKNLQVQLVEMIETKHGGKGERERIPVRIKTLRGKIRKLLIEGEDTLSDQEKWELYDDLDTLFVAVQLYSYPGQYLREQRTDSRIAETILKLEEDILGAGTYPAPREAFVKYGQPVDVHTFLKEHDLNAKTGVAPMTSFLGKTIQGLLEDVTTRAAAN